jgi:hypothetical protein
MVAAALRWSGPALALLFALAVLALLAARGASPLARFILADVLTPERLLPLIGLGAAFGLIALRSLCVAVPLFALGVAAGLMAEDALLRLLDQVPRAATHLFYASPLALIVVGAALAAGARAWSWLTPPAAAIVGAMLALVVKMTDPSLHDPLYTWTPVLIAAWLMAAIALTLRAFRHRWVAIFARILGSWLLAIGLLYGGASLLPPRKLPPPILAPPSPRSAPTFAPPLPGLPPTGQPAPLPGLPPATQPSPLPGGNGRPQP